MSWFYRTVLRPFLFSAESEQVHEQTLEALRWIATRPVLSELLSDFFHAPRLPVSLFGLEFPNPLGLAAGMDKRGSALPAWQHLGFGFTEIGGITWHPQPGNDRPRMFRAVEDGALINRMGFNNPGAEATARMLQEWKARGLWPRHPVGINLGKSKITPNEEAAEDYRASFRALRDHGDFFVINVSSPNTPNLRKLQDREALDLILAALQEENGRGPGPARPLLVKIAPDLDLEAIDDLLALAAPRQLAGIVAANTTLQRPSTQDEGLQRIYREPGGLSGRPLRERSTAIIRHIYRQTAGTLPIIGVGGVFNAADAWEKIAAGASLVQAYTGLVFEGPSLARDVVEGLIARLGRTGLNSLQEAVGCESRPVPPPERREAEAGGPGVLSAELRPGNICSSS
jgi:dihydroorotate dehydrogenase